MGFSYELDFWGFWWVRKERVSMMRRLPEIMKGGAEGMGRYRLDIWIRM